MNQTGQPPPIYLATSTAEARNPKLAREAAIKLAECRAMLAEGGQTETVQLLDIVLLQLQMQLRGISEAELKALCAALTDTVPVEDRLRDADG